MRQRIFILILSIRSNGDQMNALHLIPISTPPSIDHNSAVNCRFVVPTIVTWLMYLKENNIYNVKIWKI